MERGATSAAALLLVSIISIMFLTRDVVVVMGDNNSCLGGLISDDGTHSAYVAHVLAELTTVTPTTSNLQDATTFPGNGASGSIIGLASCSGTTDVGICTTCLSALQQALFGSCKDHVGGEADNSVCAMGFSMAN